MKKEIEILAPAGSISRMKAAFSAGADACYIGGMKFGARAFADNPNEDELLSAIYYAHLHEKKLFLTVNTLLKEEEIQKELYQYLLPYYEAGLDAAIVQDLGVMRFLSREFPDLPLHASTQMTLCDSTVYEELKKYNIERLVLSRELSLPEIARFKETGLEIECFVHGALCVCYSGQCSMSYFNGGRSGNRGSCAGPCRVEYDIYSEKKAKPLKGESYLLSPKDICSIDHIPAMVDAGIYSFKIEGRMKKPEYAALTSYLYRKWTDYYLSYGEAAFASKEAVRERKKDIKDLSDLYNRGSFTSGYFFSHNGKEMMADKRPNHNGVFVGRVKKVGNAKKKNVMLLVAEEELFPQDVVEIRAKSAVQPLYEFTLKEGVKIGETFWANFTMGLKVGEGMEVYRTKNETLLQYIKSELIAPPLKRKIRMHLEATLGKKARLSLSSGKTSVLIEGPFVEEAKSKPMEEARMKQALRKLGDTDFSADEEDISLSLDSNAFLPMSLFNEMRREAISLLYDEISKEYLRKWVQKNPKKSEHKRVVGKTDYILQVSNSTQVEYVLKYIEHEDTPVVISLNMDLFPRSSLYSAMLLLKERGRGLYVRLPEIFRYEIAEKYKKYFNSEKGRAVFDFLTGFIVRNLEELVFVKQLFEEREMNKDVIADTNLHVYNSYSAATLYDMGISSYTVSLEHSIEEALDTIRGLDVPIFVNFIAYGREELMVTTQCQWKNKYRCVKEISSKEEALPEILFLEQKRKGKNGKMALFPVAKNCESCNNYIFMEEPLNYFKMKDVISTLAPNRLRLDFTFETEEEIREVLKLAKLSK